MATRSRGYYRLALWERVVVELVDAANTYTYRRTHR